MHHDNLFIVFIISDASLGCSADDLRRLGVASHHRRAFGSRSRSGSQAGSLPGEDAVDSRGTRWRCFSTGDPPQESRVNMSVLEPFLRVLSHGGTSCTLAHLFHPWVLTYTALVISQVTMEMVRMTSSCFPPVICQKTVWRTTST